MAAHDGFAQTLTRIRAALAAMGSGDPRPYIDCWAYSGLRPNLKADPQ
jgi:hypothetical protein